MKRNILLIYACYGDQIRATTKEHLLSFKRYGGENIFYANLMTKQFPSWLEKVEYDLIIFHTLFLSTHWKGRDFFRKLSERAAWIKTCKAVKVMMPQDEFINSDLYSEFINEFKIDKVFTVAPYSLIPHIYRGVSHPCVQYERILTGYLDERSIQRNHKKSKNSRHRDIDIGYRTAGTPYMWFGRFGYMKKIIADAVVKEAVPLGIKTDVSTDPKDVISGDRWYDFLLRCRYVIGCESGTSIIDQTGAIKNAVDLYLAQNPNAGFQEIERECFPGIDEKNILNAISPRSLEAAATRTCQILVEGEYNSILQPDIHYIPLKKDLSNLTAVLKSLDDEDRRSKIVENAYRDIVESGKYTYRKMVHGIIDGPLSIGKRVPLIPRIFYTLICFFNRIYDFYGFYIAERIKKCKNAVKAMKLVRRFI